MDGIVNRGWAYYVLLEEQRIRNWINVVLWNGHTIVSVQDSDLDKGYPFYKQSDGVSKEYFRKGITVLILQSVGEGVVKDRGKRRNNKKGLVTSGLL